MLTQTTAQGVPVAGGNHLAKKKGQRIRASTCCTGKPIAGRPGHASCFQLGMFPSKPGACPARKAEICRAIISETAGGQGKGSALRNFSTVKYV